MNDLDLAITIKDPVTGEEISCRMQVAPSVFRDREALIREVFEPAIYRLRVAVTERILKEDPYAHVKALIERAKKVIAARVAG